MRNKENGGIQGVVFHEGSTIRNKIKSAETRSLKWNASAIINALGMLSEVNNFMAAPYNEQNFKVAQLMFAAVVVSFLGFSMSSLTKTIIFNEIKKLRKKQPRLTMQAAANVLDRRLAKNKDRIGWY